jgi:hypothetical protein
MLPLFAHGQATTRNKTTDVTMFGAQGDDLSKKIAAALNSPCNAQCELFLPANTYDMAGSIELPLNKNGTFFFTCDPGAVINYTGSSDAIRTPPVGYNSAHLVIQNCTIRGNPSAKAGIHTYPTNSVTVRNNQLLNFKGGDGVLVEGTNVTVIEDNVFQQNKNGVELVTTYCDNRNACSPNSSGNGFQANAIHSRNNHYISNSGWGMLLDQTTRGHQTGFGNESDGDTFELNGTGAISTDSENAFSIHNGYFEGQPHYISCGSKLGACYGATIFANHFTANPGGYDIELNNSHGASIWGNSEFPIGGKNSTCMINAVAGAVDHTWVVNNYTTNNNEPVGCKNGAPDNSLANANH